jgi:uncharacterized protein (DUF1810 family)
VPPNPLTTKASMAISPGTRLGPYEILYDDSKCQAALTISFVSSWRRRISMTTCWPNCAPAASDRIGGPRGSGIASAADAREYLEHPILGPRLRECAALVLAIDGRSATEIFGRPDDLKLRSCATLFARVSPPGSVFHRLLDRFFAGKPDEATLRQIG